MMSRPITLAAWLRSRLGISPVVRRLAKRRVEGGRLEHYLPGLILVLLTLQVATGVLLLMHYRPSVAEAHDSVMRINSVVPFGALVRGMHRWTADLCLAGLAVQVFLTIIRGRYRPPREFVWLATLAMLVVGVGMVFTGSLLPWSQHSYGQAWVVSEMTGRIPLVGPWFRRFLLGGDAVTGMTLGRAFGFHAAVLPATMTLLVAWQAVFLRRGVAQARSKADRRAASTPVYPDFLAHQATVCAAVLLVLVALAVLVPRSVGHAADPALASTAAARPDWYFLFMHPVVSSAPPEIAGMDGASVLIGAVLLVFMIVPWLPYFDRRSSRVPSYMAWTALAAMVALTTYALT